VMLPLKEKDKPIVQKLLSAGCCARCVLRFCCVSVQAAYRQAQHVGLHPILLVSAYFLQDSADIKPHDTESSQTVEDPPCKRAKLDPTEAVQSETDDAAMVTLKKEESSVCALCLGILQDLCGPDQLSSVCVRSVHLRQTHSILPSQNNRMLKFYSLPLQHSCWLHVKKEVRQKGLVLDKDDVIQVKEAFKWIMQGLVTKQLEGVAVSPFEVGVEFTHPDTESDCHFLFCTSLMLCLMPLHLRCFSFLLQSVFTRMAVVKALEKISDVKFLEHYPCPPSEPSGSCTPQDIQCLHISVFIAGRYNKFCRNLPQTPWVIDGERRMESSVEELIAAPILSAFRADGFNFSSSGREDVDVRTLGNGRPFAMELLNPHRSRFSKVEMKQLQEMINKSSDKIRVRDLQIVTREAMSRMKEGEEEKTKSYTALVWTQKSIENEDISFINDIKDLTLDQKTPLRVLHRRALAIRQRVIHSMNVRFVDSHHFYLGLKTQAGTYIKEFVHGDFGRTKPNLCLLLKTDTDILELDVESVDVDWPPPIPE
uniref:tRNA pseudouridine synthase Pus10 n=1 Tax=Xiphophorus couchianus TaxID=32473 RepID=A0A3B5LUP1_9TELE